MEDGQNRGNGTGGKNNHKDFLPTECCRTWLGTYKLRSKRIDVISRIIFPLIFAIFNLAYWSTYLSQYEAVQ